MKNSGIALRAAYSLAGLRDAWRRERSFRAHLGFTAALLLLLVTLRPEPLWWCLLLLGAATGMALEAMNGAVEALADLVEPRRHPQVRIVKDMASAADFLVNCATGLAAILLVIAEW